LAGGFTSLTQINAADTPFPHKSVMRGITRTDLNELAELRERAARLCEETKILIEEGRRLREWVNGFQDEAMPLIPAVTVCCAASPQPAVQAHPRAPEMRLR
jgi:hypothetical protein